MRDLSENEDVQEVEVKKKKITRTERQHLQNQKKEPRRFSRRLAGFSAAVEAALDLDF